MWVESMRVSLFRWPHNPRVISKNVTERTFHKLSKHQTGPKATKKTQMPMPSAFPNIFGHPNLAVCKMQRVPQSPTE